MTIEFDPRPPATPPRSPLQSTNGLKIWIGAYEEWCAANHVRLYQTSTLGVLPVDEYGFYQYMTGVDSLDEFIRRLRDGFQFKGWIFRKN